jgi:hypothetical protein
MAHGVIRVSECRVCRGVSSGVVDYRVCHALRPGLIIVRPVSCQIDVLHPTGIPSNRNLFARRVNRR